MAIFGVSCANIPNLIWHNTCKSYQVRKRAREENFADKKNSAKQKKKADKLSANARASVNKQTNILNLEE